MPHTYNIKDLNDEEIIGSFYDKELDNLKTAPIDLAKLTNAVENDLVKKNCL